MLPGDRIRAKKLKRGRGKKGKNLLLNFGRILPRVAEKGPKKIYKEVPCFTVMSKTQRRRQNLNFISS
jgi:hypothetical protein